MMNDIIDLIAFATCLLMLIKRQTTLHAVFHYFFFRLLFFSVVCRRSMECYNFRIFDFGLNLVIFI